MHVIHASTTGKRLWIQQIGVDIDIVSKPAQFFYSSAPQDKVPERRRRVFVNQSLIPIWAHHLVPATRTLAAGPPLAGLSPAGPSGRMATASGATAVANPATVTSCAGGPGATAIPPDWQRSAPRVCWPPQAVLERDELGGGVEAGVHELVSGGHTAEAGDSATAEVEDRSAAARGRRDVRGAKDG
jgi:hypothetical protein